MEKSIVREETIREAREALSDVLKNRLATAALYLEECQCPDCRSISPRHVQAEIEETAAWIDSFSGATPLEEWKGRYEEATPGEGETTRPVPGDQRRMLQWVAREKPFYYGWRGSPTRSACAFSGGASEVEGSSLAFGSTIQDRQGLLASYVIARRAARLW